MKQLLITIIFCVYILSSSIAYAGAKLFWTDTNKSVDSYILYSYNIETDQELNYPVNKDVDEYFFSEMNLLKDVSYDFWVVSIRDGEMGPKSNIVTYTIKSLEPLVLWFIGKDGIPNKTGNGE